jgi:hypothetical protein
MQELADSKVFLKEKSQIFRRKNSEILTIALTPVNERKSFLRAKE